MPFSKGDKYNDYLIASLDNIPFPKWVNSDKKVSKLTPIWERGQQWKWQSCFPESVAIHPKFFIPFLFKSLRRRGTACSIMTTGIYWVGGCFSGFYPSGRFNFCYIWRSCIWNRGSYMSGHYIWNDHENMILFIIWPFKIGFYCLQNDFYFNKKMHFWHGRCQCYVYAPKCYYTCGHTIFVTVLSTE